MKRLSTAVVYIAVCSLWKQAAARGYNFFCSMFSKLQFYDCFIKATTNTLFTFLSHNNSRNYSKLYSFYIK